MIQEKYNIDPYKILEKYCKNNQKIKDILISHGESVYKKALEIIAISNIENIDLKLLKNACLLHDIGILNTNSPKIFCFGENHYVMHGILGANILRKEGLNKIALICERHIGVGIKKEEVKNLNKKFKVKLPEKDMFPKTKIEKLICLSDKFFSKSNLEEEEKIEDILEEIKSYKKEKEFLELLKEFNINKNA
ncbi:HDIG domain-containing protein [Patescibacteria group bacterium]|nr:HDIG domain-containing protein [Patescibacteria group bacterium]